MFVEHSSIVNCDISLMNDKYGNGTRTNPCGTLHITSTKHRVRYENRAQLVSVNQE